MSLYKREETWWCNIAHEGKRIRKSTGTTDKREAQRFHDALKADLWSQPGQTNPERSWKDAVIRWLELEPRSKSDRYSLRALPYPDRPLSQCTPESFREALADKTPATYNRYRATIVAIMHQEGINLNLPMRKVAAGRIRFLTRQEWDRLYTALPPFLKPLAAFSIATGMRQHNVTHLEWSQVDMARRVAWIHPDQAKAGKAIGIPLSDDAIAVLRTQQGKSDTWVFPYHGKGAKAGRPVTKIKTAWLLAQERAGLGYFETQMVDGKPRKEWRGDFTWHGLRHTWASWHVMAGTPLEVLQKLGGWADLKMVLRYAHLAPEYLAGYANNAKPYESAAA